MGEGGLDKIPVSERNQNIAIVYNLNENVTGAEVAEAFANPSEKPLSKQRVQQISKRFLKVARSLASPPLHAEHPLKELLMTKLNPLKEPSLRIKSIVEKGIEIPTEIKNSGLSRLQLTNVRAVLKGRGIEVPLIQTFTDFKDKVEEAGNDDKKLQDLLDSFSDSSLIYFLYRDSSHETLTTASTIANEKGFHAHTKRVRFIAKTIKEAKIPMKQTVRLGKNGKILGSYYIVYAKHTGRIAKALSNDPDLQRFR